MAKDNNSNEVRLVHEYISTDVSRVRMVGNLIKDIHVADKHVRYLGESLGGILKNCWDKLQTTTRAKLGFVEESFSGLNKYDEKRKRVEHHINTNGVHKLEDILNTELNDFKKCKINIAVAGRAGVGKSSLLNTILDLPVDDRQAAMVSAVDKTSRLTPHAHPGMRNVVIWELPGCDSLCLKRDAYLRETHFAKFDAVVICFSERFGQSELWLMTTAQESAIPVYIVRTKIDQDMANDRMCRPETHDETSLVTEIRNTITQHTVKEGLTADKVFLVSTWRHRKEDWDYRKLNKELSLNTPTKNTKALLAALDASSREATQDKKKELLKRIPELVNKVVTAKNPTFVVNQEILFYAKQFGFSEHKQKQSEIDKDTMDEIFKYCKGSLGMLPLKVARTIFSPVQFVQNSVSHKIETYEAALEEAKRNVCSILTAAIDDYEHMALTEIDNTIDGCSQRND